MALTVRREKEQHKPSSRDIIWKNGLETVLEENITEWILLIQLEHQNFFNYCQFLDSTLSQ